MDKAINTHKIFMNNKLSKHLTGDEKDALYRYHLDRVHDFQHERIVHLYVTLFFGALSIVAIGLFLTLINSDFALPLGMLALIVSTLELAYIYHYYKLENGVQSLYKITRQFEL